MANTTANVNLWGKKIAAVSWDDQRQLANFEYDPAFQKSGIQLSPIKMPLSEKIYSFPLLPKESFKGVPGLLADSLPDDFGNALIDAWLAQEGRTSESFNPVERLCYTGARGMGAIEYDPAKGPKSQHSKALALDALVDLASKALKHKENFSAHLGPSDKDAMTDILRVGTSAGGARAKAVITWNPETQEVRSGHLDAQSGHSHWILKLDGVKENRDKEIADPEGYGRIEYAYYLMATSAGINMASSRLHEENGRAHFMTKRFDRTDEGLKLHMQSLAALEHFDYRAPGTTSYEQAFLTMKRLDQPMHLIEQQFKRMAFNIIARNQDDHVKNISFLMTPDGEWRLSPAYDVTYSFNPTGDWTSQHQMTLNSKRDDFNVSDFEHCADTISLKRGKAKEILKEVQSTVSEWSDYAEKAEIPDKQAASIAENHRLKILR